MRDTYSFRPCRCGDVDNFWLGVLAFRPQGDVAHALCYACGLEAVAVTTLQHIVPLIEAWNDANRPLGTDAGIERAFK